MVALPGVSIQTQIYESSTSCIYRGTRAQDSRAVVIKLLKQDYPSSQELARYRQEYAITRSLDIDGVIKAYEQQEYQRTLVILLEDFGGESLEYWMRQSPEAFCPMSVSTFLPLAIKLSEILGKIHAANIIHKDINPGNIVLNPDTGVVKIIDFGIATQFNRTNPTFKSHLLEGTLAYLSPEETGQMNRAIDYRTDFYSLGVTFYELLTGQLPFPSTDILELVHCHIAKQPVLPHELNAAIPQPLSEIIGKLMAKNAEDRYQSAWGIRADLACCMEQLETVGRIEPFLLGLQNSSNQFQFPQELYGREAETGALLAAFEGIAGREEVETGRGEDSEREKHKDDEKTRLYHLYLDKLILSFLFENSIQAVEYASQTEVYLDEGLETFSIPLFYFYDSLVQIHIYQFSSSLEKEHLLIKINRNQEKMQRWAHSVPANFQHKYKLVEAEKARILGQLLEAEEFYEQAIAGAAEHEFIQEAALAYELAAKHYLVRGREKIAQTYMKEAHDCYQRWGATAKVKDLETRYPQLFPQSPNAVSTPVRITASTTANASNMALNLAERTAALQASEAELRQVYDELRLREQELRLITDALPACISYVDANRRYCFVNRTYEDWLSRDREQILGQYVCEVLGERAYQVAEPYINQALEGQTATFEIELSLPSGKKYISTTLIPDLDGNYQVRGFYALNTDISAHKQVEEVLRQSEAQFREQAILSAFRADVDSALAQSASLPLILHRCAEAVIQHFNAAFARIWTLNQDENVLELQASAGMYTRLDGTHSRVPVGRFKVGRIAQDRCPLLTNNVFDEPSIDQAWAEREGMVAFAGYPMLLDEQLVGVIAMFTRHPIPTSNFEALEFAAREIALGIRRKQAEIALQDSETELRALFSAMPDPLLVVDAEGQILRAILSEKLHQPLDNQVARTLYDIFERSQADTFLAHIQQSLSTQEPLTIEYSSMLEGREIWFATRISPISDHSVIWLARDITDRKRAEEAFILEERNHIAREIHDTLAQAFTGIIIHARSASDKVTSAPEKAQTLLTQILGLARSGLAEARRSVETLHRPYLLESSNLQEALSRLVAQLDSSISTQIVYEVIGTAYPLSSDLENNLFRIGQEAVTNAIKHARAHEIRIELIYEPTRCSVRIKDDGQGFAVENQAMRNGFGLLGMAERADRISAELKLQSRLGQGTEIVVTVGVIEIADTTREPYT